MTTPAAWLPVAAIVGLVALGIGLDRARPSAATAEPEPVSAGAAVSGAWYCAAGDTADGAVMRVVAAAVARDDASSAEVIIDSFRGGVMARGLDVTVYPGSSARRELPPDLDDLGVAARWWGAPVAVSRSVLRRPTGGPEGYVEGPCQPEPSPRWVIPGLATAGGAQATLTLANPYDTDASVTVTFTTPDGPVEPTLLENVVVPKRSTRSVLLNEHAPERADLGVVVRTRSGRVVAEAVQTLSAAIGGVDAVSLVSAAATTSETWTVPWFELDDERVQSWLWVSNLEDRPAALVVSFHTEDGGVVPDTFDELTVAPGHTERIDLRSLLPDDVEHAGVTVRSENSVPVAAATATQYLGDDPPRTGMAIQLGAPAPDADWVLSGGPTAGRDLLLHLANPAAEPAVVDVSLWSAGGELRPEELQGLTVPAGALRRYDLTELLPEDSEDHTIFVAARQGSVVAGRRAHDRGGTLRLVATVGVPGALSSGGQLVPPVAYEPSLTQRLGTGLGPGAGPAEDPPPGQEAPAAEPPSRSAP